MPVARRGGGAVRCCAGSNPALPLRATQQRAVAARPAPKPAAGRRSGAARAGFPFDKQGFARPATAPAGALAYFLLKG